MNNNNQSDNIFYTSNNNNNNKNKKWTVNSAIDRPPLSTNALRRAVSLLNSIPLRRDFDSQLQKFEDYEEAQCDAQVREWQTESENVISSDENPDNFKFALKGLLACAEKLELDRLRKRISSMKNKNKTSVHENENDEQERLTSVYQSLKKGWQVITHCFQCAVDQGADLDKMLSVIGYMGIWHDELPTPAGGRRPGAIHEIHQQLYALHQQQQQQQQNNYNNNQTTLKQIAQVVKGIRALDRLQLEETGRELVPDEGKCNCNNVSEPVVASTVRYETVEERREQKSIADYLKQRHPTIQPNDDNSSFVRQSLELRQAVVLAKLTQQQQRASSSASAGVMMSPVERLFIAEPTSTIQLFPQTTSIEIQYNNNNNQNNNQNNQKSLVKNVNQNQPQQQQSLSQMKNIQTSLIRVVPEAEQKRSPTTPRNYRTGENRNNNNNSNSNSNQQQQRPSSSTRKRIIDITNTNEGGGSLSPSFEDEEQEIIVQSPSASKSQQHSSSSSSHHQQLQKRHHHQMLSVDTALSPLMPTPMAQTASYSKHQQQHQQQQQPCHHNHHHQSEEEDDEDEFFEVDTDEDHVPGQVNYSNASNLSFSNPPPTN